MAEGGEAEVGCGHDSESFAEGSAGGVGEALARADRDARLAAAREAREARRQAERACRAPGKVPA